MPKEKKLSISPPASTILENRTVGHLYRRINRAFNDQGIGSPHFNKVGQTRSAELKQRLNAHNMTKWITAEDQVGQAIPSSETGFSNGAAFGNTVGKVMSYGLGGYSPRFFVGHFLASEMSKKGTSGHESAIESLSTDTVDDAGDGYREDHAALTFHQMKPWT